MEAPFRTSFTILISFANNSVYNIITMIEVFEMI